MSAMVESVRILTIRRDSGGDHFEMSVQNVTIASRRWSKLATRRKCKQGGLTMRILIICALVLTGTVALGGCFHHEKAVVTQPLKLG